MPSDVITRVRALDPHSSKGTTAPEDLLREILARPREAGRRRGALRRRTPAMVAVASGAVAVTVMGIVLVRSGDPRPVDPLAGMPPARVDWGMTATVTPPAAEGVDEARARVRTAIAQRARKLDAAGITVTDVGQRDVQVRIPGAWTNRDVDQLLRPVGRVDLEGARRYGTHPPLPGPRVRLPASLRSFGPRAKKWIAVVRTQPAGGGSARMLYAGVWGGTTIVATAFPDPAGGATGRGGTGVCGEGPGAPRVRVCESSIGGGVRVDDRMVRIDVVAGRARPEVGRIAVRSVDDTWVDATIQNGWFMVTADTVGPHTRGRGARLLRDPLEIRAWDRSGRALPVVRETDSAPAPTPARAAP